VCTPPPQFSSTLEKHRKTAPITPLSSQRRGAEAWCTTDNSTAASACNCGGNGGSHIGGGGRGWERGAQARIKGAAVAHPAPAWHSAATVPHNGRDTVGVAHAASRAGARIATLPVSICAPQALPNDRRDQDPFHRLFACRSRRCCFVLPHARALTAAAVPSAVARSTGDANHVQP